MVYPSGNKIGHFRVMHISFRVSTVTFDLSKSFSKPFLEIVRDNIDYSLKWFEYTINPEKKFKFFSPSLVRQN